MLLIFLISQVFAAEHEFKRFVNDYKVVEEYVNYDKEETCDNDKLMLSKVKQVSLRQNSSGVYLLNQYKRKNMRYDLNAGEVDFSFNFGLLSGANDGRLYMKNFSDDVSASHTKITDLPHAYRIKISIENHYGELYSLVIKKHLYSNYRYHSKCEKYLLLKPLN